MVRYLGYSNEVGEAFRSLVPVRIVHLSYGIASGYVLADAFHKGYEERKKTHKDNEEKLKKVSLAAGDCLIWQGFASVIIPGFTINRICTFLGAFLKKSSRMSPLARHWTTTLVGLACIPFIIKPIDNSVEYAMDRTFRKLYSYETKGPKDQS